MNQMFSQVLYVRALELDEGCKIKYMLFYFY